MRTPAKMIFSVLSAGVLVATASSTASADEQGPYKPPQPNESGWIVYSEPPARSSTDVYTVQGEPDGNGTCHFQDEADLAPGESSITVDELAFNPETCESRIAAAPDSADEAAPVGEEEAAATAEAAEADETEESDESAAVQAATRSSGYLWSWYEDPPGIKVTEAANHTTWSWNGSSVLSSPVPTGSQATRHFGTSGWSLESRNWRNVYNSWETTSSTYAHFRNNIFCATIDTHVYADRNTVNGQGDGNLHGEWNWSKSGGCNALLSFHNELERTQN
ncbi:hypothetical protein ACFQZ2_03020 [Streptomonospora algeriensis]|uniref:Secreted protein n=1 Tax=Streptomonospora algeriensis TaxID=995084 RepID=A0ABW3BBA0_9ACTN